MRVLLDECLPRHLKRELVGHDARTVPEFLTSDRNLSYQQDVSAFDTAVVVLVARSNSIDDVRPLVPPILQALADAERGRVTLVGG